VRTVPDLADEFIGSPASYRDVSLYVEQPYVYVAVHRASTSLRSVRR
jgi:hypothetical protein